MAKGFSAHGLALMFSISFKIFVIPFLFLKLSVCCLSLNGKQNKYGHAFLFFRILFCGKNSKAACRGPFSNPVLWASLSPTALCDRHVCFGWTAPTYLKFTNMTDVYKRQPQCRWQWRRDTPPPPPGRRAACRDRCPHHRAPRPGGTIPPQFASAGKAA